MAVTVLAVAFFSGGSAQAASGNIRVNPGTQTVASLSTNFTVNLTQNADVATSGAQASFTFDRLMFQIQSIALGPAYGGGTPTTGNTIANANTTGTLSAIAGFVTPPTSIPTGDQTFVTITMRTLTCGKTLLTLSGLEMIDTTGANVPATGTNGEAISVSPIDFYPLNNHDGITDHQAVQNDTDCDGYPDSVNFQAPLTFRAAETTLGTNPNLFCSLTQTANDEAVDAWPVDNNDSQLVNISDLLKYNPAFGTHPGDANYSVRLDLNANNLINISDLLQFNPFMFHWCK